MEPPTARRHLVGWPLALAALALHKALQGLEPTLVQDQPPALLVARPLTIVSAAGVPQVVVALVARPSE